MKTKPLHLLAAMTAALGFAGPIHGKPIISDKLAPIGLSRASTYKLMLAGGYRARHSKPWPFRGKNRAQRERLNAAFFSIS